MSTEVKIHASGKGGESFGGLVNTVVARDVRMTLDPSDLDRVHRSHTGVGAANSGSKVSVRAGAFASLHEVEGQLTVGVDNDTSGREGSEGTQFLEAEAKGIEFTNVVRSMSKGGATIKGAVRERVTNEDAGPTRAWVGRGRTIRVADDGVIRKA